MSMNTLPAGKYFVGDPCYVFDDDSWSGLMDKRFDEMSDGVTFFWDGKKVWTHSTAYGDGEYGDSTGRMSFGVDAGLIGVVPVELATEEALNDKSLTIIEFMQPFNVLYDGGVFYIGHIIIDTSGTDEEDEEYDEYVADDGGFIGDLTDSLVDIFK